MLELHPDNPRDHHRLMVVASGGLYLANIDDVVSVEEEERIMHFIAQFTVYPRDFLDSVRAKTKSKRATKKLMLDSIKELLKLDPGVRYHIFDYLCQVAMSDRHISDKEVKFLMELGTKEMGMHEIEASRAFVTALQAEGFRPKT